MPTRKGFLKYTVIAMLLAGCGPAAISLSTTEPTKSGTPTAIPAMPTTPEVIQATPSSTVLPTATPAATSTAEVEPTVMKQPTLAPTPTKRSEVGPTPTARPTLTPRPTPTVLPTSVGVSPTPPVDNKPASTATAVATKSGESVTSFRSAQVQGVESGGGTWTAKVSVDGDLGNFNIKLNSAGLSRLLKLMGVNLQGAGNIADIQILEIGKWNRADFDVAAQERVAIDNHGEHEVVYYVPSPGANKRLANSYVIFVRKSNLDTTRDKGSNLVSTVINDLAYINQANLRGDAGWELVAKGLNTSDWQTIANAINDAISIQ